jgi:proteasome assembly chaperone (PAC2) family protein
MANQPSLHHPWLIAVWPGMGHVALNGGYYLLAKLEMYLIAEFSPRELFEVEHVEVKDGKIMMGSLPRSRFFLWKDPQEKRDVVVFIGDAQPTAGRYAFCHKLIDFAKTLGVERVFTFAAMATGMHPHHDARTFGAATDDEGVAELKRLELEILEDGHIGGLNGVLVGVAAEQGLRGTCLLGEIPSVFAHLPYPRAARGVLDAFGTIAGMTIDFAELDEQARVVEEKLGEILGQVEAAIREGTSVEEGYTPEVAEEGGLSDENRKRLEALFDEARQDRSKAYVLKRELDRLNVFKEYEDRFLDLFRPQGESPQERGPQPHEPS